jgi:hypothetical protein
MTIKDESVDLIIFDEMADFDETDFDDVAERIAGGAKPPVGVADPDEEPW